MHYKANEIEIPSDDPYKNDQLNRKPEVKNLSILLKNISSPIVLSINAPWGTGKTVFLKMLHQELKLSEKKAIYFSAWETDFANDPLLAFLGEINAALDKVIKGEEAEAWKKAKKAGLHIVKRSIPILLKLGTAGIIDTDKIVEDEASELVEVFSKDLIKEYGEKKTAIDVFKKSIAKLLSQNDEKIYIIVDELDRCRPTYAIELLERIKHLLDIEGIVFVLALDRKQLSHSVRGIYGAEFAADGYLKRFIDLEYTLNEVDQNLYIDYLFNHFKINDFFAKRDERKSLKHEQKHMIETFKVFVESLDLSLRDIEQLVAKLNLVILSTEISEYTYPPLLTFLLVAKEYYPDDYKDYIRRDSEPDKMIKLLRKLIPKSNQYSFIIEGFLISAKQSSPYEGEIKIMTHYREKFEKADLSEDDRHYIDKVFRVINKPLGDLGTRISLDSLIKRIEMTENFRIESD